MYGTVAITVAAILERGELHATIFCLSLLVIPQLFASFVAAWLVASLGVFVRDIVQGITLLLMAWMYLTPIIYPETLVPGRYKTLVSLNPFTPLVRNYRRIILEGRLPAWRGLA